APGTPAFNRSPPGAVLYLLCCRRSGTGSGSPRRGCTMKKDAAMKRLTVVSGTVTRINPSPSAEPHCACGCDLFDWATPTMLLWCSGAEECLAYCFDLPTQHDVYGGDFRLLSVGACRAA